MKIIQSLQTFLDTRSQGYDNKKLSHAVVQRSRDNKTLHPEVFELFRLFSSMSKCQLPLMFNGTSYAKVSFHKTGQVRGLKKEQLYG